MDPRQTEGNTRELRQQPLVPRAERTRPQRVTKQRPQSSSRRSVRLQHRQDPTVSKKTDIEPKHPFPSPDSSSPSEYSQNRWALLQDQHRKRKRTRQPKEPSTHAPTKRPCTSIVRSSFQDTFDKPAVDGVIDNKNDSIAFWVEKKRWPKECFDQDEQTRKNLLSEHDSWFDKYWEPAENMDPVLARKPASSSLRGKQLEVNSSTGTSSDQKQRETKSAPYKHPRYGTLLATKGVFMDKSDLGITDKSKGDCESLLNTEQSVPSDSLFRDNLFETTCRNIQNRNETRVIRDISLLIVPSAQILATYGATKLQCLIESTNEGWNNSIPLTKTRPQPDYSVGFRREAFTEDQLKRLEPFVGSLTDTSFFMATYYMYFPFLTCEAKCGAAALDIADRQNAHSMGLAVRAVVELYRLGKREMEIHREILAFSVSHSDRSVRIYGHYPIIDGRHTTIYRHPIRDFSFQERDGREKWAAYRFTKNVYDTWMPNHFKRICSVIDKLPPDVSFEVSQQSEPGNSRLSEGLEGHRPSDQASQGAASLEEVNSETSRLEHMATPENSLPHRVGGEAFKKPRKRDRPSE